MKLLWTLTAAAALGLFTSGPALAVGQAAPANVLFNYRTEFVPQYHGAGAFVGELHLVIGKDGIVSGFYRPEDGVQIRTVTGGVTGDKIWLNLGAFGSHIDGTLKNGTIVGYTYSDQLYKFTAVPSVAGA